MSIACMCMFIVCLSLPLQMLSFMKAQYTLFQQGFNILDEIDPYMKKLAAQVQYDETVNTKHTQTHKLLERTMMFSLAWKGLWDISVSSLGSSERHWNVLFYLWNFVANCETIHNQISFFLKGKLGNQHLWGKILEYLDPPLFRCVQLDQLVIDSAVEKREMEHKHALIQQRVRQQLNSQRRWRSPLFFCHQIYEDFYFAAQSDRNSFMLTWRSRIFVVDILSGDYNKHWSWASRLDLFYTTWTFHLNVRTLSFDSVLSLLLLWRSMKF